MGWMVQDNGGRPRGLEPLLRVKPNQKLSRADTSRAALGLKLKKEEQSGRRGPFPLLCSCADRSTTGGIQGTQSSVAL
jgi:hypothetical protein